MNKTRAKSVDLNIDLNTSFDSLAITFESVLSEEQVASLGKRDSNKARIYFALILASNSIGVSSLAYPSAMANTGVFLFIALMILAIFLNYLTGYLLVFCAKVKNAKNYSDLTYKMIGNFKIIVDFTYILTNMGIMVSCILSFNDFMSGLFHKKFISEGSRIIADKNSLFWIILPNLLLIPIMLRKNYRDLTFFSAMAVIAIIFLAFFSIYLFG